MEFLIKIIKISSIQICVQEENLSNQLILLFTNDDSDLFHEVGQVSLIIYNLSFFDPSCSSLIKNLLHTCDIMT